MTLGAFIATFDLLTFIIGPTVYFPFMLNSLNKAIASLNRVKRIEELLPASVEEHPLHHRNEALPKLTIDNLSFIYGDKKIINKLSFSYSGTGVIVIIGKSGRGKTTLLDLIAGLLIPSDGKIEISGDISSMPQDSFMFNGIISENVLMGNLNASIEEVDSALKRAGAEGLDTAINSGKGGSHLSGGQRQRISLARTILSNAPIWLLDEPTSALDADTESIILNTLEQERNKRLIIVSAHRRSLIDMADSVIDLDSEGGATA